MGPCYAEFDDHGDGEGEDDGVGHEVEAADCEGQFAVCETVHRYCDVPFAVPDVAEADDGGEGDPVVDCAVDDEGVDYVAQLRLQLEDAQVEEADGHFDEVVGCGAGGEGGHDPLDGLLVNAWESWVGLESGIDGALLTQR